MVIDLFGVLNIINVTQFAYEDIWSISKVTWDLELNFESKLYRLKLYELAAF